jgi:nicotinamide mononucleotide transporter
MNDPLALFGFSTTPLELISFVLALINVALNIRQSHWAWLFAIVSSAAYGLVFFNARLYGDMGLQLVFIAVSLWGWWQWLSGRTGAADGAGTPGAPRVSWLDRRGWILMLAGWLAGFALLSWFLRAYTDTDVPRADAFLTAGSLAGSVLLARKKIENWHVWIVVDVLYVALYVYKGLHLTALLYAVFVLMAALGLRAWVRVGRTDAGRGMVLK